jgi:hypothetical protein
MWCTQCHADVAAELAANGQALNCAHCGHEIQKIYTPSLHPEIKNARELLERWSREERVPQATAAAEVPEAAPVSPPPTAKPAVSFSQELKKVMPEAPSASAPPSEPASIPAKPVETAAAKPESATPSSPLRKPVETETSSSAENKSRRQLERPALSRAAKPKTVWRADNAHAPVPALDESAAPKPVSPLASIDTTPPAPLPVRAPKLTTAKSDIAAPAADSSSAPLAAARSEIHPERREPRASERAGHESLRGAQSPPPPVSDANTSEGRSPRRRRHDRAEASIAEPHFDLQTYIDQNPHKQGKSETVWGQLLAYAGVAVLTVGTTMVLWGYFGGQGKYTATGFLVSTAGQMLLFLGVITLVSGGMQQTSAEVSTRVEYLGGRMIRMEQAAGQILKSPYFARKRRRKATSDAPQRRGNEAA